MENNKVTLLGRVVSEMEDIQYKRDDEEWCLFYLEIRRLDEKVDKIDTVPVLISKSNTMFSSVRENAYLYIQGELKSYNLHENGKSHLAVRVFAREINFADKDAEDINEVILEGIISKPVIYRRTSLNKIRISDIFLAFNEPDRTPNYFPCIAWGETAKVLSYYEMGTKLKVYGRFESREYLKKYSKDEVEKMTTYEISAYEVSIVN